MRTTASPRYCRQCNREMHDVGGYAAKALCFYCQPNKYGKRKKTEEARQAIRGRRKSQPKERERYDIVRVENGKSKIVASVWLRDLAEELTATANAVMATNRIDAVFSVKD